MSYVDSSPARSDRSPSRIVSTLVRIAATCAALAAVLWIGRQIDPLGHGLRVDRFADPDAWTTPVPALPQPGPSTDGISRAWLGPPPDRSSLIWSGALTVLRGGRYTFATTSDDGSWVYVDRRLVVDNGGVHGVRTATGAIDLAPGVYPFQVRYMQYNAGYELAVQWARGNAALSTIPSSLFRRRTSGGILRALPGVVAALLWLPVLLIGGAAAIAAATISAGRALRERPDEGNWFWLVVPTAMAGIAAWFTVRLYSPVPFFDEWEAAVPFVLDVRDGQRGAWWAQFNEHRILLTRVLLYPVLVWFGGREWLLNVAGFGLVAVGGWCFWRLIRTASRDERSVPDAAMGCVILGWLFLWSQRETLAWGFNVAFLFAMVLAIVALLALAADGVHAPSVRRQAVAAIAGCAAVGSMANGIVVLPLLAVFAWRQRAGWRSCSAYALLSVASVAAYLHRYVAPVEAHGSVLDAVRTAPLQIVEFIALFLGSPFSWLAAPTGFGVAVAGVFGFVYITGWAVAGVMLWRDRGARPAPVALWLFATYVLATAAISGVGRTLVFGARSALWSRYTTAAVWGWAALAALWWRRVPQASSSLRRGVSIGLAVISIVMLVRQFTGDETGGLFTRHREIPGLALAMQVRDFDVLQRVHYSPSLALAVSARAIPQHLSLFARDPYRDLPAQLDTRFDAAQMPPCLGMLTEAHRIEDAKMVRVHGWLFPPGSAAAGQRLVRIVSGDRIVGFATNGQPGPDAPDVVHPEDGEAGITGYVPARLAGSSVVLINDSPPCRVDVGVPIAP